MPESEVAGGGVDDGKGVPDVAGTAVPRLPVMVLSVPATVVTVRVTTAPVLPRDDVSGAPGVGKGDVACGLAEVWEAVSVEPTVPTEEWTALVQVPSGRPVLREYGVVVVEVDVVPKELGAEWVTEVPGEPGAVDSAWVGGGVVTQGDKGASRVPGSVLGT